MKLWYVFVMDYYATVRIDEILHFGPRAVVQGLECLSANMWFLVESLLSAISGLTINFWPNYR